MTGYTVHHDAAGKLDRVEVQLATGELVTVTDTLVHIAAGRLERMAFPLAIAADRDGGLRVAVPQVPSDPNLTARR